MRSCEDNLARRAWASAPRVPPVPAPVPAPEPSPAARLRELLAHPGLRPVYRRLARRALESGDAAAIASELAALEGEVVRAEASAQQLRTLFPTFYPLLR